MATPAPIWGFLGSRTFPPRASGSLTAGKHQACSGYSVCCLEFSPLPQETRASAWSRTALRHSGTSRLSGRRRPLMQNGALMATARLQEDQ